jgi:N-methylhydantoinase B
MTLVAPTISETVTTSVLSARLGAIVDDMAAILANVARSSRISVRRQFGCALLDPSASVAAADNPRYLASLEATTQSCLDAFRFDLAEDDVVLTNDPYGGTPSVHYFTLVAPVKIGHDATAYVAVQAHMGDIGGWVMGNYDPTAREVRTEGVRISPFKIVKFGRRRRDVVETIILNSRFGEMLEGDLNAMLAAVRVGQRELERLAATSGTAAVRAAMERTIVYAERRFRSALARLPDGSYDGEARYETDAENLCVRVTLTRSGEHTTLDFTRTDAQSPFFVNCAPSVARMQAILPLLGLLDEDGPWNSGILRAVEVVTEPGTLVAPLYPAPTGWSPEHVGSEVSEAVRHALAAAVQDLAGPGLPVRSLAFTVRKERRVGSTEESLAVTDHGVLAQPGSGAAHGVDGWGQPGPEALGRLPSVEEFEQGTGLAIRQLEYRCDSAGGGRWRGAPGTSVVVELPQECHEHLYAIAVGTRGGPSGLHGGLAGGAAALQLLEGDSSEPLAGVVTDRRLEDGVALRIDAAGGAGFGDPALRPREDVRADLVDGLLSDEAARQLYGDVR